MENKSGIFVGIDFLESTYVLRTSLVAQTVKRLPTMWETWVWSLGREDPLEKEMETHYIIIKNKPRDRKQARKLYELKKAHRC